MISKKSQSEIVNSIWLSIKPVELKNQGFVAFMTKERLVNRVQLAVNSKPWLDSNSISPMDKNTVTGISTCLTVSQLNEGIREILENGYPYLHWTLDKMLPSA